MTVMDTVTSPLTLEEVASNAGLTREQTLAFRNVAASMQMEGMPLTLEELRVGAEVAAGRLDFAAARLQLGA